MIIQQAMRDGGKMPKRIAEAPELRIGLELYYGAFMDLCTSRQGFGDGPISWSTVNEYAKTYEFDEEQRENLQFYIGRMDTAYMQHVHKKTEAKNKK